MRKSSPPRPATLAPPRVRRGYFECRYGQLHVHNAIPAGGGFEEDTPLLCLHPVPHSGRVFVRFLSLAGTTRSVFAPDLPGFGDSDPPSPPADVAAHAAAIGDFLETMRLRQVDLLGQGFGALVAAELAASRPGQVRRLALVAPPRAPTEAQAPPRAAAADGSHLLEEWHRALAYCGPSAPPAIATAVLAERLRNGAQAAAVADAQRAYPLRPRLAQLALPLLVLRLGGEAGADKGQEREMPARARLIELPERHPSLFETAPELAVQALESFLR